MNIALRVLAVLYGTGLALMAKDAIVERRKPKTPSMPDSIEDQLDIAIHTREIEERASCSHKA